MRLPGKATKQCHSLAVGHQTPMHVWWVCLAKELSSQSVTHSLPLVTGWDDWWDCIAKTKSSITHKLLVMGWEITDETGKEVKQCYSQTIGHEIKHDWWDFLPKTKAVSLTNCSMVMGWDIIEETAWQRNKATSLTRCRSQDETRSMRLPGKEIKQCHSHAVGWDETWLLRCLAKTSGSLTHSLLIIMGWDMIDETNWQRK